MYGDFIARRTFRQMLIKGEAAIIPFQIAIGASRVVHRRLI